MNFIDEEFKDQVQIVYGFGFLKCFAFSTTI